jgi:hypothetical protein
MATSAGRFLAIFDNDGRARLNTGSLELCFRFAGRKAGGMTPCAQWKARFKMIASASFKGETTKAPI